MKADLQAIRNVTNAATLSDETRHVVEWSLNQLPRLYRELAETSESRFSDEILRVVRMGLKAMVKESPSLAETIAAKLEEMHERLGIPKLNFTPPPVKRTRPPKAS